MRRRKNRRKPSSDIFYLLIEVPVTKSNRDFRFYIYLCPPFPPVTIRVFWFNFNFFKRLAYSPRLPEGAFSLIQQA